MEIKIVRVLDIATDIGVMLIHFTAADCIKHKALSRAGFSGDYILYQPLDGIYKNKTSYEPDFWDDRTHHVSHLWISSKKWEEIPDTINVEEILEKQLFS